MFDGYFLWFSDTISKTIIWVVRHFSNVHYFSESNLPLRYKWNIIVRIQKGVSLKFHWNITKYHYPKTFYISFRVTQ